MPSTFTLDDIREAADKKYGATKIVLGDDTVELRNVIRLSSDERKALTAYFKEAEEAEEKDEEVEEEEDDKAVFDRLSRLIYILAGSKADAEKLLGALDGRLDLLSEVIGQYMADQKSPKAEASQS